MSNEERKKRMEDKLSQIRQDAARLEGAIQENREREEFAQMVEEQRNRQDAAQRTFAAPRNAEEAESRDYTLVELAAGIGNTIRAKEDILENGTLVQKLRLYFGSEDISGYFGQEDKLTKEDVANIKATIRTEKDKEFAHKCYREYAAVQAYGGYMRLYFKRFQTQYSILAVLLNKWEHYEDTARNLTRIYKSIKNDMVSVQIIEEVDGQKYDLTPTEEEARLYAMDFVASSIKDTKLEGAQLVFDEIEEHFSIDPDNGLYTQIEEESKTTREAMEDFKAFAVVIEEFIKTSTLQYMPISIRMSMENAKEERYARYLVNNTSFFRSELNERKSRGENITPEEEKRAAIPDFYEVEPNKEVFKSSKKYIKDLLKDG